MYFVNLQSLVQQHKENRFTVLDSLNYCIGSLLITAFFAMLGSASSSKPLIASIIGFVVVGAIMFFCMNSFYKSNGGDDGTAFLDRLVSLNFVLSIRLYLPITVLSFAVVEIGLMNTAASVAIGFLAILLTLGSFIFYLIEMNRSLTSIANQVSGPTISSVTQSTIYTHAYSEPTPSNHSALLPRSGEGRYKAKSESAFASDLEERFGPRLSDLLKLVAKIKALKLPPTQRLEELRRQLEVSGFTFSDSEIEVLDRYDY